MIIWITGISGSGKTTIAKSIVSMFHKEIPEMINVDGDEIRELFNDKLGYSEKDRYIQIQRIQRLCYLLEKQNQVVVASALYSREDLLQWNRKNFYEYYEIYLSASIALVKKRDVKGLYKRVEKGLEKNVVGVDIPWSVPKSPDLKIDCDKNFSLNDTVLQIIKVVPRLRDAYESLS